MLQQEIVWILKITTVNQNVEKKVKTSKSYCLNKTVTTNLLTLCFMFYRISKFSVFFFIPPFSDTNPVYDVNYGACLCSDLKNPASECDEVCRRRLPNIRAKSQRDGSIEIIILNPNTGYKIFLWKLSNIIPPKI